MAPVVLLMLAGSEAEMARFPSMPWHHFHDGSDYELSEILTTIERHLRSGDVLNVEAKRRHIRALEDNGSTVLRFAPEGGGHSGKRWERSPMNARAWLCPDGTRLTPHEVHDGDNKEK